MTPTGPSGCHCSYIRCVGPLGVHGQAVELARHADREVAHVDHLLHLAEALAQDLADLERDQAAELLLVVAQPRRRAGARPRRAAAPAIRATRGTPAAAARATCSYSSRPAQRTLAIGSPVAGLIEASVAPEVAIGARVQAPALVASMPRRSSTAAESSPSLRFAREGRCVVVMVEVSAALRPGPVRISCGRAHDRASSRAPGRSVRDLERDFSRRRRRGRERSPATSRWSRSRWRRRRAGAIRSQLGRGGEVLLWALLAAIGASAAASPVPRAGLESLAVLPAFLLVPAAVERIVARRPIAAASAVALSRWWLVAVAGVGAGGCGQRRRLARRGADRTPRRARDLAALRAAVRACSPRASAAPGEPSACWRPWPRRLPSSPRARWSPPLFSPCRPAMLWPRRRARWWALAARRGAGRRGERSSPDRDRLRQRSVDRRARAYLDAGWAGLRARPALGWGPGSVGWTVGEHLQPAPGRNPPGEVVSYLHFLPLDLAYQLGIAGALLAAAVVAAFLVARRRERAAADDAPLFDASMAALVPGLAALCSRGFQPLPADDDGGRGGGRRRARVHHHAPSGGLRSRPPTRRVRRCCSTARSRWACSAPVRRAQRLYDQARTAPRAVRAAGRRATDARPVVPALRRAAGVGDRAVCRRRRRMRRRRSADESRDRRRGAARRRARARRRRALARRRPAGRGRRRALGARRRCGAPAISIRWERWRRFDSMTLARGEHAAAVAGARALLAEPRLAAALEWEGRDALYQRRDRRDPRLAGSRSELALQDRERARVAAAAAGRSHQPVRPRARRRSADVALALRLSTAAVADPARLDRARF